VTTRPDFNAHAADESARFVEALRMTRSDTRVPTCPDWDADDLLWHLGEVQEFWATVIRDGITDDARVAEIDAARPAARDQLFEYFNRASAELLSVFAEVSDDAAPAWTWSTDRTVGFIRRRQAHEALIHRVDAEVTAGARTPMDAALCADGVDEILRVMYGGAPAWGTFTPRPDDVLRLIASDTGDSWVVQLGQFTGHDPTEDAEVDEVDIRVLDDGEDAAQITATAADLDLWLWHRPPIGRVDRSGDTEIVAAFESVVAFPIN
jgi:uncharacterized protein (TIGR03083 family)